ncbi:MAG: ABC transporter substrate-binding protein [Euryarchaeota archaeon]|jgi:NitT/TauT family transport system substrate-binding protein|nr:ABC transporter substrate-binding protein [Euryarchaeota archaeon]
MKFKCSHSKLFLGGLVAMMIVLSYATYHYLQVEDETITVGYLPSNHHSALFIAQEIGMYKKANLKLRLVPFRSGSDLIRAMKMGQVDVGYCGIAPVTMARSNGTRIKVVATVNTEGSGLVIPSATEGNLSQALQNKTVAIPRSGSVQDVLLHQLLQANNLSTTQLSIIELETPLMPPSLKNGKIDAYLAWEPYVSSANISGDGKILAYSDQWWDNHPCCVIVAREEFIQKDPSRLSRFLKVHQEATLYLKNHPEDAARIVSEKLGTSLQIQREALKHVNFQYHPDPDYTMNMERFMKLQQSLGYLETIPSTDDLYDLRFL